VLDLIRERRQLTLGEEYAPGAAGRAFRAELPDGTPAVWTIAQATAWNEGDTWHSEVVEWLS
jgi:hypothetical protein